MTAAYAYAIFGIALLAAVILPMALRRWAMSAPMVLVLGGFAIGYLPWFRGLSVDPIEHPSITLHATELCVLVALMGVGLALDRPLNIRSWASWRSWRSTWRLLAVAMPLCIAAVTFAGWWVMGLPVATALLLAAALAPTDPVLAGDVQVEGPTTDEEEEIDEHDEVRFALTSEAGLNDALAFPFVYAAIALLSGPVAHWGVSWALESLLLKTAIAIAVGYAGGRLLAWLAFRPTKRSFQLAQRGEPLLALAATLLVYGLAEIVHGWGFLAVFVCALTIRSVERHDEYHALMHEMVERLELLLTLGLLLMLGLALGDGLLEALTWRGAVVGILLLLVIRPAAGWLALGRQTDRDRHHDRMLGPRERVVTAFFGVRGIGSLYYVAYAAQEARFPAVAQVWSTVGFTILVSVVLHGVTATPVMRWLDDIREETPRSRRWRLRRRARAAADSHEG